LPAINWRIVSSLVKAVRNCRQTVKTGNVARPDRAASSVDGLLRAARFVEPTSLRVILPSAANRSEVDTRSEQVDQLLFGEVFDRIEFIDGHSWGQARRDGYVGWVEMDRLGKALTAPSHWVSAQGTYVLSGPSLKTAPWGRGATVWYGGTARRTKFHIGIHTSPAPAHTRKGVRQPGSMRTSKGAKTMPMPIPTCVMAAPSARFSGSR
jgi:hypothetical protein